MSKFWGCIGLHWSYKRVRLPIIFRPEVVGAVSLLGSGMCPAGLSGLLLPPGGTVHARVQEGSSCQCPEADWLELTQLTTARAGHWSTPLYTGTHPKVVLGLFDRHDLIPWAGCFSGWNVCVCERKMSTSSLALPKEDLRLWYKELTDCF